MKQPGIVRGRWRAAVLAAMLLAGSGCAMTRLQPPQLQVVEVGLVGASVVIELPALQGRLRWQGGEPLHALLRY